MTLTAIRDANLVDYVEGKVDLMDTMANANLVNAVMSDEDITAEMDRIAAGFKEQFIALLADVRRNIDAGKYDSSIAETLHAPDTAMGIVMDVEDDVTHDLTASSEAIAVYHSICSALEDRVRRVKMLNTQEAIEHRNYYNELGAFYAEEERKEMAEQAEYYSQLGAIYERMDKGERIEEEEYWNTANDAYEAHREYTAGAAL